MFAWTMLFIAGICEIMWAQSLKLSDGFTKLMPSIIMIIFSSLSFYCLALAMRQIPLGIAYAIWTGIGTVGLVAVAHFVYGEQITIVQLFLITMIIIGSIGLKISS